MSSAVAYIRVSTSQQGKSGLGIEAQRAAIARFIAAEDYEQIAEFVEVETGKGERCPGAAATAGRGAGLQGQGRGDGGQA